MQQISFIICTIYPLVMKICIVKEYISKITKVKYTLVQPFLELVQLLNIYIYVYLIWYSTNIASCIWFWSLLSVYSSIDIYNNAMFKMWDHGGTFSFWKYRKICTISEWTILRYVWRYYYELISYLFNIYRRNFKFLI